jgi:hypothetical protein
LGTDKYLRSDDLAFQSNLSARPWFRGRLTDKADTGFRCFSFSPESA